MIYREVDVKYRLVPFDLGEFRVRRLLTFAMVFMALATFGADLAAQPPPDATLAYAEAESLANRQDFAAAAVRIATVADVYSQDYALQLQSAWYFYQAKNYPLALTYYGRADALTDTPGLAHLGLAWTHLRLGDLLQARRGFEAYLAANPDNPATAHDGVAEIQRLESQTSIHVSGTASFFLGQYDQNPREDAIGGGIALSAGNSGFQVAAAYTYGQYGRLTEGMGMGNRQSSTATTREHLGYASVGYGRKHGGMSAHGVFGSLGANGTSYAGGLIGRMTWFTGVYANDLRIELTYGSVLEQRILQTRITQDFHIVGPLWVAPGLLVQRPDSRDVLATGTLAASLRGDVFSVVGTGRYGSAFHEVIWHVPLLVTHQEDVLYGATLGIYGKPSSNWAVGISGAWEHYANQDQTSFAESDGFFGIVSLTLFSGGDSQ